jgi:undecaprenyl-diphosphatase
MRTSEEIAARTTTHGAVRGEVRASSVTQPAPSRARRWYVRALRLAIALMLAVLLLYVAVWTYALAVTQLGPLGLVAYTLLVGLLLAVVGPWLLVRYRTPLRAAIVWIARHVAPRPRASHTAASVATSQQERFFARLARVFGLRAVWSRTAGVWLTLGLIVALALAWVVAELALQVVDGGALVGTDQRILNLVATLRTPELDQVMFAFTFLASTPVIVAVTAVAVAVALLARRYADALILFLAPVAGGLFVEVVKLLIARPRPPLEDARIVVAGFSFPSGHATLAATLYGTLAYLIARDLGKGRGNGRGRDVPRVLIGIAATLLIFAVGLSRIYLGVHYPSDVLAGWVAGAFWLVLVVVAEHVWLPRATLRLPAWRRIVAVGGGMALAALAVVYLATIYPALPPAPTPTPPTPVVVALDAVPAAAMTQLPRTTETIFGAPQEPVSLVFVGTRDAMERAFLAAGWTETQRPSLGNVAHALLAGVTERADAAGPVAPSFLADEPNALAFAQAVGNTFAQRHHVRLWTTNKQTSAGQPIWLATASFDTGFGLAPNTLLPTHHIAPDIDAERDYLVASLKATGDVTNTDTFQLVPPESGHNFAGDPFTTNGQAVLVQLA